MQELGTRKYGWEFSLGQKLSSFSPFRRSVTNRQNGKENGSIWKSLTFEECLPGARLTLSASHQPLVVHGPVLQTRALRF